VCGDRNPTVDDIMNLKFTTRVINESMRLYPQPPVLIRRALEPVTLDGYNIEPGTVRPGRPCSPRHRLPTSARFYGSNCVSITWRALLSCPRQVLLLLSPRHRMPFDSRSEVSRCVG